MSDLHFAGSGDITKGLPEHKKHWLSFLIGSVLSWRNILLIGGLSVATNILIFALPLYILQVFDRVIRTRSEETLFYLTLGIVGALLFQSIIDWLRTRAMARIANRVELANGGKLLDASVAYASKFGQPTTQAITDMGAVRRFVSGPGILALFDLPWVAVYVIVVYMFHPWLGTVMVLAAALLFVFTVLAEVITRASYKRSTEQLIAANRKASAIMGNAQVVEAMGMRKAMIEHWFESEGASVADQFHAQARAGVLTAAAKAVRLLQSVTIIALGAYVAINNEITIGAMIAANILATRGLQPLEQLVGSWNQLITTRESMHRLADFLQKAAREENEMTLPAPKGRVNLEKVVYTPPGAFAPVIKGVTFALEPGTFLGLLGPSAAGKTTLAKLLVGVLQPQQGRVSLDGADVFTWNRDDFGQYVGYVPQEVSLFEGTVRQNIVRFSDASDAAVVEAAQLAGAHEMILALPKGYDTPVGPAGATLSGGQRQRIALARAFFGKPRFLVLDEPNASLDSEGDAALARAIDDAKAAGTTIIMISHRPAALGAADKLAVLVGGKLEAFGPYDEVAKLVLTAPHRQVPGTPTPNPAQAPA